jgi:ferredoxin-thioredoxin reductase catalytic subunit/rubredoxin
MNHPEMDDARVENYYQKLKKQAESAGYHLNPHEEFTKALIEAILVNEDRYGYGACPCRLASGIKAEDLDIICPCDYRDPDLQDYNACYCGLYVTQNIINGETELKAIPERRPAPEQREKQKVSEKSDIPTDLSLPVWRCKVCGYLCAREEPPETCPICKVDKDRFERLI